MPLPHHLDFYRSNRNDQELFEKLRDHQEDLLLFFKWACEEQERVQKHSKFLRLVLRWVTKQFYLGHFPLKDACRFVKVIQEHYSFLKSFLFFRSALFFTVKFRVENEEILANSLLFGVGSPELGNVLKQKCFEKLNDQWTLEGMKRSTFQFLQTYFYEGRMENLSSYSHHEVMDLIRQVEEWRLHDVVKYCLYFL